MQLLQFPEMGKQPIKKNNNRCMDSGQNDDHCLYIFCSRLLTVSAAPNYPSHRSTRDCPASVSLVLVHAFIVRGKRFFQCLFSHIHGFISPFKDTQERKMKLFIILDHTGRNGFSNSDL